MSSNNEEEFKFLFEDNRELVVPKSRILEISQTFYFKNLNNDENIIKMPKFIKQNDLDEFIKIFQKYISRLRQFNFDESFISIQLLIEGTTINISKLIQLSEFFGNNTLSMILIKDCILSDKKEKENMNNNHKMNLDNALILLLLSYNKLKDINSKEKTNIVNENDNGQQSLEAELENIWLDLFIKALEMIGNNLNYYFKNDKGDNPMNNKLWNFDKKIIDELYDKFSLNLILNNFIINTNEIELDNPNLNQCVDMKELNKIINFLIKKRNQNDFFSLLSNEFMKIISEDNINEINNLPNPTFTLKISVNDINNYYEEYPVNNSLNFNDNMKIIIVVYYKKNEDSFNVSIKLSKSKNEKMQTSFDIITFLSLAVIEEIDNKQINVKSLTNNKSMYEILRITNFKKIISSKNDKVVSPSGSHYITLKVFLKPCFIYTMLCNYLFYNLENLYNNKNITKLSKNLLGIIIKKKQLVKNEEDNSNEIRSNNVDKIVMCLINWLNDEINVGEDISEIIKNIKWDYASLPLLFEFLIKYSIHIISDDIEYIFSRSLARILKCFNLDINLISKEIIHSLILSSKKLNFISIFCENIKIKKFNFYDIMSKRRNISLQMEKKHEINSSNKSNSNNLTIEKISKNEITIVSKNQSLTKDDNNNIQKEGNKVKKKLKIGINNSPGENKILNNNNNISYINKNSDVYYNNYFTKYNNNFNINIIKAYKSKNNKNKRNISLLDKNIISQIKIKKNNNIQRIKDDINNNTNTVTPNKKIKINTPISFSPKIKGNNLGKFNSNKIFINYKNFKNIDEKLLKEKLERKKNLKYIKNIKLKNNNSESKNKSYINERFSYINNKKCYPPKNNNESLENNHSKKSKNTTHISLLNDLLNLNKKGKFQNSIAIKINQSLNIKKNNLTQINLDKNKK